jgi:hypothetical protein
MAYQAGPSLVSRRFGSLLHVCHGFPGCDADLAARTGPIRQNDVESLGGHTGHLRPLTIMSGEYLGFSNDAKPMKGVDRQSASFGKDIGGQHSPDGGEYCLTGATSAPS